METARVSGSSGSLIPEPTAAELDAGASLIQPEQGLNTPAGGVRAVCSRYRQPAASVIQARVGCWRCRCAERPADSRLDVRARSTAAASAANRVHLERDAARLRDRRRDDDAPAQVHDGQRPGRHDARASSGFASALPLQPTGTIELQPSEPSPSRAKSRFDAPARRRFRAEGRSTQQARPYEPHPKAKKPTCVGF